MQYSYVGTRDAVQQARGEVAARKVVLERRAELFSLHDALVARLAVSMATRLLRLQRLREEA